MKKLGQSHFQCIVIGGGIVGAGIFRDLALHGVETLLIDSGDFSAQTSERSSKMLHGGIRYLENMDFKLVFEALHEKNLWLKLTPHLAREEAFFLPVYKNASRPLWMIRLGLFLYDLLSQFKNSPYQTLSQEECIKRIPDLNPVGLSGAGVYYDGIMDDVKITLEVIYDSLLMPNTYALNHTLLTNVSIDPQTNNSLLTLNDQITGEQQVVSAEKVIAEIKTRGEGLFVVGLDIHVGYILYYQNSIMFIHSNYYQNGAGGIPSPTLPALCIRSIIVP